MEPNYPSESPDGSDMSSYQDAINEQQGQEHIDAQYSDLGAPGQRLPLFNPILFVDGVGPTYSQYHQYQAANFETQQAYSNGQSFSAAAAQQLGQAFFPIQQPSALANAFVHNNASYPQITPALAHSELAAVPLRPQRIAHPPQQKTGFKRTASMDSSTTPPDMSAVPANSGPLSKAIQVPARPKPGRKPMPPGEASDRRRTQNRMAQRNFRDKRTAKVQELGETLEGKAKQISALMAQLAHVQQDAVDDKRRMMEQHRAEKEHLHLQIQTLQQELLNRDHALENQASVGLDYPRFPGPKLSALSSQSNEKPQEVAIPTPPEDNWNEIDMADVWTRSKPANHHQQDSTTWSGYDMDTDPTDSGCGFCTDESNCACRASVATIAAKQTSSGPGTCDMCQRDPARAAACRSLADKTQPSTSPQPELSTKTMSCGQFIDKFNNRTGRMPSIAELLGPIHSFPARSGFNVDEQEAAKALQGMSTMNPASQH